MYDWVRPEIAIPVHGERRHLIEHAQLAKSLGTSKSLAPHNGEMIRLAPSGPDIVDIVPSGRLHQDGNVIVSDGDEGLRLRRKMAYAGQVSISLVVDKAKGRIISGLDPRINGFPHGHNDKHIDAMIEDIADEAEDAFRTLSRKARQDEDLIEDRIRSKVKKRIRQQTGKRSVVEVIAHIV